MKLVIQAYDVNHANYCLAKNIDGLIIGQAKYSLRDNYYFTSSELEEIIKKKQKTKIFVKVNAFFFEQDIEELSKYLKYLSTLDIDGVIFSDFAIAQLNEELALGLKLKYAPETLVTSYYQFDFFKEINCSSVTLARELSLLEVADILKHKLSGLEVEMQGQGFMFIMHSRWNLISNFENYYDITLNHRRLSIREDLRKLPNYLIEDEHGTHMFSGYQLYTFDMLDKLENLDWLRIDTINMKETEVYYSTDIYAQCIQYFNQDLNRYKKFVNETIDEFKTKFSTPIAHGFLGKGTSEILHMEKDDE